MLGMPKRCFASHTHDPIPVKCSVDVHGRVTFTFGVPELELVDECSRSIGTREPGGSSALHGVDGCVKSGVSCGE